MNPFRSDFKVVDRIVGRREVNLRIAMLRRRIGRIFKPASGRVRVVDSSPGRAFSKGES